MHGLTAHALRCKEQATTAENWFAEDIPLLCEHRPHHFGDRLAWGKSLFRDREFLQLLADMRRTYGEQLQRDGSLSDGEAPYHFSVFPYDFAAPEQEVLRPGTCPEFDKNVPFDHEVEEILVELLTGIWG